MNILTKTSWKSALRVGSVQKGDFLKIFRTLLSFTRLIYCYEIIPTHMREEVCGSVWYRVYF